MATVGADLATLSRLKKDLDASAAKAASVKSTLDRSVHTAVWTGPNSVKFRAAWAQFSPTFTKLQQALTDAATDVRKQHNNIAAATGSPASI